MKRIGSVVLVLALLMGGCQPVIGSDDLNQPAVINEKTVNTAAEATTAEINTETSTGPVDKWGEPVKVLDFMGYYDSPSKALFYMFVKDGGCHFKIQIDDASITARGVNLTGDFDAILLKEGLTALAVSEIGPSDDDATYYYCLDDNFNILYIGQLPGLAANTVFHGDGTLNTRKRGWILQTWFYDAVYRVNDSKRFEQVPADLYPMNTSVKMLVELPLVKSRDDDKVIKTLEIGEECIILSTDDKRWCLIQTSDGTEGWFEVEDGHIIKALGREASNVFEGLSGAD